MIYSYCGKQVLLDNRDFAQAKSIDAAELIADLLNADQQRRESRGTLRIEGCLADLENLDWVEVTGIEPFEGTAPFDLQSVKLTHTSDGLPLKIKGRVCRAYQASDQMLCRCGKQWDVNDPDPPTCDGI